MMTMFLFMVLGFYAATALNESQNVTIAKIYEPNWNDLDSRPLPSWYDSAKIGIIVHWGVYSVPSFLSGEWFWYDLQKGDPRLKKFMMDNYNGMRYQDFAPRFDAALFAPDKWAELFALSGAKYVILTAKHHDGFALFPSGRSNWNSVDVGPKIDIVGALSNAVRKYKMKFGVHYSLLEWFNKLYHDDKKHNFISTKYTDSIIWPDIKFLVNEYKPSVLSADGNEVAYDTYWRSKELLAWLYNESPVKDEIVVNDKWGKGTDCRHGSFYNCKSAYNRMTVMPHKWEYVFSLDRKSWGYRRDMLPADVLSFEELLKTVVSTVSSGGNVLINVGPTANGTIKPVFEILLKQLGEWLTVNGEAIYNTTPCFMQNDKINLNVWYTCNKDGYNATVSAASRTYARVSYVIFLKWPIDNMLRIGNIVDYIRNTKLRIELLKSMGNVRAKYRIFADDVVQIELPGKGIEAHTFAWVLKISRHQKPKEKLETEMLMVTENLSSTKKPSYAGVSSSPEEHYLAEEHFSLEENSSSKYSSEKPSRNLWFWSEVSNDQWASSGINSSDRNTRKTN